MKAVLFNPATADPGLLAALHAACFPEGWSARAIADLLDTPDCFAFSINVGGMAERRTAPGSQRSSDPCTLADGPDGFILARAAGGEAEILTLAVAPMVRGRGLGCALVRAAAAHARSLGAGAMFLEVGSGNKAALALYQGLGFAQVGERRGYYEGADALVLKADLPLPPEGNIA